MFKRHDAPTGTREDLKSARARLDRAMLTKLREQDRVFAEGLRTWSGRPASEAVSQVRVTNPESIL
jgi:hypothetical protein